MATNPMQRRARNSFLVGILITTMILGAVIAFLIYSMMELKEKQKLLEAKTVYVLKRDIESGDVITSNDLTSVKVSSDVYPANAVNLATFEEALSSSNEDEENNEDRKIISKINLNRGTIVTSEMLYVDTEATGKDVRRQEYNTIVLPMDLETGDFIDVRLLLPNGQDFIVVSRKKVEIPQINGVDSADTIFLELSEDEILSMSSAIVEAYMINGSKLYATKYIDAGNQEQATPTYPVNGEVANLVESDPNILPEALSALRGRYNRTARENYINPVISSQTDAGENEKTNMQESITNTQKTREEYLQSLTGTTPTN